MATRKVAPKETPKTTAPGPGHASGAPAAGSAGSGRNLPTAGSVRIRMYNTGFGDCFLLRFPGPDRELKVLIDCGKHTQSTCKPSLKKIVQQVQADLRDNGKARVDVLVVTHRHLDHVSGFALDGWNDVEVGELWMPWTEDPDDPVARRICERQSMRALQLQAIVPHLNLNAKQTRQLLAYAGNNLTNAMAMRLLHEGFRGQPKRRFLPVANAVTSLLASDTLPGVEVHVLGPSRSEVVIRDMDPPQGESFLRATVASTEGDERRNVPFSEHWTMDREAYSNWFVSQKLSDPLIDFSEETAKHLRKVMESPEMELAAALEKSVNGTSLVLLFKVGRAVLLFPGDAQWGTWNEIMQGDRWHRLLKSITFYKVGHHGSHNATPRQFVQDVLPATACAMIPTDNVKQWPMIPKEELVNSLRQKGVAFVRSDVADTSDDARFQRHTVNGHTVYVDLDLPTA